MTRGVFLDTSGFFAVLDRKDRDHLTAKAAFLGLQTKAAKIITTDYVLAETYTLLRARGLGYRVDAFREMIWSSRKLEICWTSQRQFEEIEAFFIKHIDKGYSFTDCLSFVVMHDLKLTEALTTDRHFEQAGFKALLADGKLA